MFCLLSILLNGMCPRILSRVVNWKKLCGQFSVEFEEGSEATLAFVRTWDRDTFRRVCVAVLNKYSGEVSGDAAVLGQFLSVVGPSVSLVALVGGSHVHRDTCIEFAGSGHREKLVKYPIFDLQLLKRSLQKCAQVVFGSLDPFSMTEFIIVRLKGAEHKDWIASRHALRRAVLSDAFPMPSLVEVVAKIVCVWPLIFVLPGGDSLSHGFASVFSSVTDVIRSSRTKN